MHDRDENAAINIHNEGIHLRWNRGEVANCPDVRVHMKRILLIISHYGSDVDKFVDILNENPRIQITGRKNVYAHPSDLDYFVGIKHKLQNTAAIYGDYLLDNTRFLCKELYKHCNFVYFIRDAKQTFSSIQDIPKKYIFDYYAFRLQRMAQMVNKSKGVVLTWNDLESSRGLDRVESYLNLKQPLNSHPEFFIRKNDNTLNAEMIERAQDIYEKYFYKMRKH